LSGAAPPSPDYGGRADGVWQPDLATGFRVQGRVIHALLLRELQTRFGRGQLGFLWLFLEPLLLSLAIATLKWTFDRFGHTGVPIFMFAVIGYAPYFAFRTIVNRSVTAFQANMTLMYHRQVRLFDIVVARNLLESAAVTTVLAVVIGASAWLVDMRPHSVPALVGGLLLMFLYSHGLSMLVAAGSARWEAVERMVHPLTYLALPFSGAFFALHWLPPSWRDVLLWNPQANMHEMVREGMFGDFLPTYYSLEYIVAWVVGLNLLGMAALRAVRPRLEF
jgi:capsular polysaccharide transport system permease protein